MSEDLKKEKELSLSSLSENDHNPKYNINEDRLNEYNKRLKNISHLNKNQKKSRDGIITKKRTKKEYNKIWATFLKNYALDFKKYMGYGVEEIKKIGFREFIDFMDWRNASDIKRYRTDVVKVIPCQNCGKHFTTYQMDFGLCKECTPLFDISKFTDSCIAIEENTPGDSQAYITLFTFVKEFRDSYKKDLPFSQKVENCILLDDLSGNLSKNFLLEIIGDKNKEQEFMDLSLKLKSHMTNICLNKSISIVNILKDNVCNEAKIQRILNIF